MSVHIHGPKRVVVCAPIFSSTSYFSSSGMIKGSAILQKTCNYVMYKGRDKLLG
jgi:hypothetical protein